MKLLLRLLAIVFIAFVVNACEQRIQSFYNPTNVPIPENLSLSSSEEIGETIRQAAISEKWSVKNIDPGQIEATYRIRTHQAIVRIDYSAISYSITYASSINLLDDGIGIHRNYNSWVRNLESAINVRLRALAGSGSSRSITTDNKAMLEAWKRAEKSDDPLVLQDFMDEYGDGPFAGLAQKRLNQLAQIRTGGIKKFNPTGLWQVSVSYKGGNGNSSWCGSTRTWKFTLDFSRGRISQTVYDSRYGLHVTGENSENYVYLHFDYPTGGSQWEWTERFKLDRSEKRLMLSAEGGAPSGCTGTLGVHMKKVDTANSISSIPAPPHAQSSTFDPTGLWKVYATYNSSSGTSASCIQIVKWNFTLDFHRGKISRTVYSGRTPLYLNGENSPGYVDLQINVPDGGTLWRWTERFVLDSPDKFFRAESPSGGGNYGQCHGTIGVHMKKIETPNTSKVTPAKPKLSAAETDWLAIKNSKDPEKYRSFLKDHIDSDYAQVAINRLNSLVATTNPKSSQFAIGRWQVEAVYTGHHGNAAYCPNGERWRFALDVTDQPTTKEVWSGRNDLYISSRKKNDRIVLKVDIPRGGNNWQWLQDFKLDQKEKYFLAESTEYGGAYGGCTGKLSISMKKLN